ncbi:uncharacterized protein LOC126900565 isoform X2 [Daktulosphaira vitifoliae]|uniref:uncharacterized protein LOC126900565 isoform X2 n=1 Tax=Daktulosphaira vitifoliae TaxID=58002 RepID=UPI0021AA3F05|nr:uncharacterized protein LOC126900565 isoform X2 [Daktulosphaira vitifoliae]
MNFDSIIIFLIFATYGSFCKNFSNDVVECPFCSIKKSSAYLMVSHINNEHVENTITICPECRKDFQNGSVLEVHFYLNHINKIEYDLLLATELQLQFDDEERLQQEENFNRMSQLPTIESNINHFESDLLYAQELQKQLQEEEVQLQQTENFSENNLEAPTVENISEHIRRLSEISPGIRAVYLASSMDNYMTAYNDFFYGCSLRCMQMWLSSLMLNEDYKKHLSSMFDELYNMSISRYRMPTVKMLEYHIEECWNKGIHTWRKKELYAKSNYPTQYGYNVREMDTMLVGLRIKGMYRTFDQNINPDHFQNTLIWLYNYFRNETNEKYVSPVILHYPGIIHDDSEYKTMIKTRLSKSGRYIIT